MGSDHFHQLQGGCRDRDRMVVECTITCTCAISVYHHFGLGEVYSIQHYMIKFFSNLRQIGSFLLVLRFPQPIKLTGMI